MELTNRQRRWLRGQAHGLDALLQVGRGGINEGVVAQLDDLLRRHELIKGRFVAEREERGRQAERLAAATDSNLVGSIGRVAIFYRRHPQPKSRRYDLP